MHAEARGGVDLADAAADVLVGLGDVGGEEVDAADVEADGADGADRHLAVVGVDDVGDVDRRAAGRQVGGGAQVDDLALGRDGVLVVALLGQHALGLLVELEPGQHLLVADAAARVLVHDLDQLLDRALAVADDVAGHALGGGDQLAVDHQQAMVEAFEEALDQHGAAVLAGGGEGRLDLLLVHQADADAAAMIGVERLDHDREADAPGGRGRVLGVVDHALLGHGQAEIAQQPDGLLLVRGELDRDVRRRAGDRGLDPLLEAAVAELDQALAVQPQPGDVALLGRRHQGRRARAQRLALGEADEAVAAALEVEMLGVEVGRAQLRRQEGVEQLEAELARLQADLRLLVLVDDEVLAGLARAPGLAEGDGRAGDVLQLDRDMLEHVAEPGALALVQAADEAAGLAVGAAVLVQARAGSSSRAVDEAGAQPLGRPFLERAQVQRQPDHREQGVDVGADIDLRVQDLHGDLPTALPRRSPRGRRRRVDQSAGLPARASRVSVSNKSPLTRMCNLIPIRLTGSCAARGVHRGVRRARRGRPR